MLIKKIQLNKNLVAYNTSHTSRYYARRCTRIYKNLEPEKLLTSIYLQCVDHMKQETDYTDKENKATPSNYCTYRSSAHPMHQNPKKELLKMEDKPCTMHRIGSSAQFSIWKETVLQGLGICQPLWYLRNLGIACGQTYWGQNPLSMEQLCSIQLHLYGLETECKPINPYHHVWSTQHTSAFIALFIILLNIDHLSGHGRKTNQQSLSISELNDISYSPTFTTCIFITAKNNLCQTPVTNLETGLIFSFTLALSFTVRCAHRL